MVRRNRENRTSFLRVKCPDCENEQTIFDSSSTVVDCAVCGHVLAEPQGGKASVKAEILSKVE